MEPQAGNLNQFLILGLHIIAVIGLLFFLRRLHNGLRRQLGLSREQLAQLARIDEFQQSRLMR